MRNYTKKSDCPIELARIISAVNELPPDSNSVQTRLSKLALEINESDFNAVADKSMEYFVQVQGLVGRGAVLSYLFGSEVISEKQPVRVIALGRVADKYRELTNAKIILRIVGTPDTDAVKTLDNAHKLDAAVQQISVSTSLVIDENRCLRPFDSGLIKVLRTADVVVDRIKSCAICRRIFWGKKITAQTCGLKVCANALSQKTFRDKNKSKINEARRVKYLSRKKEN